MKIKYFFAALVAAITFWACEEENPIAQFTGIEVSGEYLTIPAEGGSVKITVKAEEDWTVSIDEKGSAWLTVAPSSGKAGESVEVSLSASSANAARKASVSISTPSKTKIITVNQAGDPNAVTSCKFVIEQGERGTRYRVSGIVTSIVNKQYGNFYINDGTVEGDGLYIYGVKNDKDQYPKDADGGWESFGFDVGDNVVLEGPMDIYNGTIELKDCAVISVSKGTSPVLSCEEPEKVVAASDTEATFVISAKNLTENWTVTTTATWLTGYTQSGTVNDTQIVVSFPANTEPETRIAEFTVKSSGAADLTLKLTQGGYSASGTLEKPYTVEEIIAALKAGPVAGNVYVKGIISNIVEKASAQYGNATFWISDDGVFNDDLDKDFEAYRVKWLGGTLEAPTAGADIKTNIMVGDEVVLYGAVTAFTKNDATTYETSSGKAKLYSLNWAQSEEDGVGNIDYPFNIAGAKKFIDDTQAALAAAKANGGSLDLPDVAVKGKVNELVSGGYGAQYGNGTFWISDDGTAKDFEVYRALYLENKKFEEGMTNVAVGDEVIVKGQLTKYNTTYETSQNNAYLYSLNGVTTISSGPSFAIDGDMSDWEGIEASYDDSSKSRIRQWKFASDADNVYFYLLLRKNRVDSARSLKIGFDTDNNDATGSNHGNLPGCDAGFTCLPFTNEGEATQPVWVEGVDNSSTAFSTAGENSNGVVSCWAYDSGADLSTSSSNIELEVSVPKSALALPAAGTAIKIGCSYDWYVTDMVSITL